MNRNNKLAIYEFLRQRKSASLREISEACNIPQPATHNALTALHKNGSIHRNAEVRPIQWEFPQ